MSNSSRNNYANSRGWLRVPGIPIFVFHGLSESVDSIPPSEQQYWVKPRDFRNLVGSLVKGGYRACSVSEIFRGTADEAVATSITFDDGLISDYSHALPVLAEYKLPGEFFVSTSKIGTPGYMDWNHLNAMRETGMSIQSHGHSHQDLQTLSEKEITRELEYSKHLLEDKLGSEVTLFAAPFGSWNSFVLNEALRIGYKALCTARSLPARSQSSKLDRIVLHRNTTTEELQQYLSGNPARYFRRTSRSLLYRWPLKHLISQHASAVDVTVSEGPGEN